MCRTRACRFTPRDGLLLSWDAPDVDETIKQHSNNRLPFLCASAPLREFLSLISRRGAENAEKESNIMAAKTATPTNELRQDLKAFHHYLQAERGLAKNTLLAYGRDLERFAQWAQDGGLKSYLQPTVHELSLYLSHLR